MRNLVLITSVINTLYRPLSYSNVRSVFSMDERFEQTKMTIASIQKYIPNSKILIVEGSDLYPEYEYILSKKSDYFINLYYDKDSREKIQSKSKSLGEGTMTSKAIEFIYKQNITFDNFFKISGRYWLSEDFRYQKFNNSKTVIKFYNENKYDVFTALYKLPKKRIFRFYNFLQENIDKMYESILYEKLFGEFIRTLPRDNIHLYKTLGITGFVATDGSRYKG